MKPYRQLAVALLIAGMSSLAFGQDKFFDSNGVRIRYIEQGAGEPVVLVHGYAGAIEAKWITSGVFQQLSKNFRVIALDCRGHGKSDKPHDVKQYGQEMALDIVRLLDHLRIQKAHIVGYSMGAAITAKLLTMEPERFLTAMLGGAGGALAPTELEIKGAELMAAEVEKGSLRTLLLVLSPKDQPRPTEEEIKQSEASLLAGNDLAALAAVVRSFVDLAITEAQVAAINAPTMAIVGTADPNIGGVNKLKKAMPKLKVVTVEGATHLNAFGRPEFIEALQEFLKANSMREAVEDAMRRYAAALRSGTPQEVSAWYTQDGELLLPGTPALHGREAIRAFLEPLVSATEVESVEVRTEVLEVTGGIADQWGTYRQVAGEKGKAKQIYSGRYAALWRRESGGQWRLQRLMMQPTPVAASVAK